MQGLADFTNKRILIAGASSGIGRETALRLNELGASIIAVARREDKLLSLMQELKGGPHACYPFDLTLTDGIEALVKRIVSEQGKLDGMVYSAGVNTSLPLNSFKPDQIRAVFDINFYGFVELVRQCCRRGRYNEGMRIVGVSSVAAQRGDKAHLAYSASKAAMNAAVRCIAKEVAGKGICINTVAPAMVRTEMYDAYADMARESGAEDQALLDRQYLGLAETVDVANAIAYLLSPAARFMTGLTIPVDGGLTTS